MKLIFNTSQRASYVWCKVSVACITCLLVMAVYSCNKDKFDQDLSDIEGMAASVPIEISPEAIAYYGPEKFNAVFKKTVTYTPDISNPDFEDFENFILKVQNSVHNKYKVKTVEIKIDGELIVTSPDFIGNTNLVSKPITLTPASVLEITLEGKGNTERFINLLIEGTCIQTLIIPTFTQIGPLCQNSTPPELPSVSTNDPAITGTWDPEIINTSVPGITTYTFTPDEGQNATTTTMDIEVISPAIPLFTQIGPLYQNSTPPELPEISENGITGTWDPEEITTSEPGQFTYTFTPAEGQCAIDVTMEIEIICQLSDADGNCYKTVEIGTQTWMAENLKTTKYNDGSSIDLVEDNTAWSNLAEPGYCWYANNEGENKDTYGALYNWHAVSTGKLCPASWHVPTDAEWTILETYLIENGYNYDGTTTGNKIAKALAADNGWWESSVEGAVGNTDYPGYRNKSKFTARPGGYRFYDGSFRYLTYSAIWWSFTQSGYNSAYYRGITFEETNVIRIAISKTNGFSIRCLKN